MKIKTIIFIAILNISFAIIPSIAFADYYVDKDAKNNNADGSKNDPFKSLEDALEATRKNGGDKKIILSAGTYKGKFVVPKGVDITGKGTGKTILQGTEGTTLLLKGNNAIKKITVEGGSKGIVIAKNVTATIDSTSIKKTSKVGIETSASTKMPSKKILITNSDISDNSGKGLYIQKTNVTISENNIQKNGQEGIDIRQGVHGLINNNHTISNKESGIELIIGNSDLQIINNQIKNNKSSGISTQYYKQFNENGSILVNDNKLSGNDKFAIDCSVPQGAGYRANYWADSISQENNIFHSNNLATFGERCNNLQNKTQTIEHPSKTIPK
jgi:hypothetical protein